MIEQTDVFVIVNHDLYTVGAEAILIFIIAIISLRGIKTSTECSSAELQTKINSILRLSERFPDTIHRKHS